MSKQNVQSETEKKEKKKEDGEKQIQEKLEAHAIQKHNKENENLILMTQNYHKYFDNTCECSTIAVPSRILNNAKTNWMSSDKLNELRRKAHEAVRMHKVFILKGFFHTVRKALTDRGWVSDSVLSSSSRLIRSKSFPRLRKLTFTKLEGRRAVLDSYLRILCKLCRRGDRENRRKRECASCWDWTTSISFALSDIFRSASGAFCRDFSSTRRSICFGAFEGTNRVRFRAATNRFHFSFSQCIDQNFRLDASHQESEHSDQSLYKVAVHIEGRFVFGFKGLSLVLRRGKVRSLLPALF